MTGARRPSPSVEARPVASAGFPRGMRYVPVPGPIFGSLLEQIDDLAELKCILRVVWMLHRKKGARVVTLSEILADRTLAAALSPDGAPDPDAVRAALARAVRRGVLATAVIPDSAPSFPRTREPAASAIPAKAGTHPRGHSRENPAPEQSGAGTHAGQRLFALNSEQDRAALARLAGDGATPPSRSTGSGQGSGDPMEWEAATQRPNVFAIYEDNVGMITPMIAEELERAEADYPAEWIEDAVREAVSLNRRSWRYIARILERWKHEGRDDGEPGRRTAKTSRY